MKLIPPAEISAKIMTLLAEADHKFVIVSPYNDMRQWTKIRNYLVRAIDRGVEVSYYHRQGEAPRGMDGLGLAYHEIPNLHAKLYMNEKAAIVTSMNLVRASDEKSLDIGIVTTNSEEYAEVAEFLKRYIEVDERVREPAPQPRRTTHATPNEMVLEEFYRRQGDWDEIKDGTVQCRYRDGGSGYMQFGVANGDRKVSMWLHFDAHHRLSRIERFAQGKCVGGEDIHYDKSTSKYHILISVANMVAASYGSSIRFLWFESEITAFCPDGGSALYRSAETAFQVRLPSRRRHTFSELVDEIAWYAAGNTAVPRWLTQH